MRLVGLLVAVALSACATEAPKAVAGCPPVGWSKEKLEALKTAKFAIADAGERQALAKGLLGCLASPDPELRDRLAFEAIFTLARGKQLEPATMKAMIGELYPMMERKDAAGFAAPFAALTLAEMA